PDESLLANADFSDLFWEETRTLAMRWEEAKLERLTQNQEQGAGLRSFAGEESRYAALDSPSPDELQSLSDRLGKGRPWTSQTYKPVILRPLQNVSPSEKAKLLEKCHQ